MTKTRPMRLPPLRRRHPRAGAVLHLKRLARAAGAAEWRSRRRAEMRPRMTQEQGRQKVAVRPRTQTVGHHRLVLDREGTAPPKAKPSRHRDILARLGALLAARDRP